MKCEECFQSLRGLFSSEFLLRSCSLRLQAAFQSILGLHPLRKIRRSLFTCVLLEMTMTCHVFSPENLHLFSGKENTCGKNNFFSLSQRYFLSAPTNGKLSRKGYSRTLFMNIWREMSSQMHKWIRHGTQEHKSFTQPKTIYAHKVIAKLSLILSRTFS